MRSHIHHVIAASGLLLAALSAEGQAQINLPFGPENYEHDFQLFAPVELDLDNEPYVDDHGYFASYNKLAWSFSGERVTVGDPSVEVLAEIIYRDNPTVDEGDPPPPYIIQNGLQDVYPDAGFGWGDRYEIGYRDRGNGWLLGILDGPVQLQNKVHGMTAELTGTTLPPIDPDYVGPAPGPFFALGFGNTHVNFATPPGYLQGFRDYLNLFAGAAIGTQVGPVAYVGNYGGTQEPDADDDMGQINFVRITDDIDEDGIFGAAIIVGPNGITTMTDFGDLHTFNIAFDQVVVRSRTKMSGIEAMWSHELTNRHYQAKHQNNHLEVGFGARFLKLDDNFSLLADGGIMGRTSINTWFANQIVGPQVRGTWVNQRQRWRLTADTRFTFGYNVQDWEQENGIGTEFVPGAINRPLYAQPTYSHYGLQQEDFSPVGELRAEASYYLTQSFALNFGYTGMYVGSIRRAAPSVRYFLPDIGYQEAGTQELIVNGVDFGVEFVY